MIKWTILYYTFLLFAMIVDNLPYGIYHIFCWHLSHCLLWFYCELATC